MKRLLAATSVCALVLAGAALAQTSTGTGRDTQGMSQSQGGMSSQGSMSSQGTMQNRGSTSSQGSAGSMSNQSSGSMSSQGSMGSMSDQGTSSRSASRGGHAGSQDIMQAQTELKQMGLYNGQVDGKMGKQTKQAISKFQKQNGLRQTAQLDRQTKDRLMQHGGGATSGSTSTSTSSQGSSMQNSSGSGATGGSSR